MLRSRAGPRTIIGGLAAVKRAGRDLYGSDSHAGEGPRLEEVKAARWARPLFREAT